MNLIDNLKWRYATKEYNPDKIVSDNDINIIKEAIQLAATSYGLQLFKVLDIKDKDIRAKLKSASWEQSQVTDASHFFVFCNYADVKDKDINDYIELKAATQAIDTADLEGYAGFMKSTINQFPIGLKQNWTAKQTYIALGKSLAACAELKIDSTPMEGFDATAYNEILGLEDKGLQASVVMAIGYRSEKDLTQHSKKVRKSIDDLFETV